MNVFWKERIHNDEKKLELDEHGNPIYTYEEKYGKIVGAFSSGGGSADNFFVIAINDGSFKTVSIDRCYHKETVFNVHYS